MMIILVEFSVVSNELYIVLKSVIYNYATHMDKLYRIIKKNISNDSEANCVLNLN